MPSRPFKTQVMLYLRCNGSPLHEIIRPTRLNSIVINLLALQAILQIVTCGGVDYCYSDIGCFPLSAEFYHPTHRPFNVRPWHRRRIKTQFELFNEHHPSGYMLQPWDRLNLQVSGFDPRLETKIIIPGWLDNIRRALWVRHMRDAFQWLWTPVNVIVVKWRNFTPYTVATANTRVVGAELANLLKFIEKELNYDRSYHHIIGHSLGAHIAGYCGDRLPGLGRITALDPARPFFQHMPKSVRLDRGDARFVDAIHSDFTPENAIFLLMSFGMTTPVGHVDFYPNGPPLLQPGCLRDTLLSVQTGIRKGLQHSSLPVAVLESMRYLTACDHQRSHEWFTESIVNRQCVFVGVRCSEFEGLINGRCTCDDSPGACAIMGIHADQMYLNKMHNHIWPRAKPAVPRHPSIRPLDSPEQSDEFAEVDDDTRDEVYSRLKLQATQLRQPPEPSLAAEELELLKQQHHRLRNEQRHLYQYDESAFESIGSDEMFVNYLRAFMFEQPAKQRHQISRSKSPNYLLVQSISSPINTMPLLFDNSELAMLYSTRRSSMAPEEDAEADSYMPVALPPPPRPVSHTTASHLPKLMSDYDRDIEEWYEDNSRWHLRTQNRPAYCANQYQVLVFIGPLRSGTGASRHARLRSNLLISIIGTRGQLINQRFVPRSSQLDSYTMQPFYILLEGSYSLGRIKSVAIGWEARHDPDPIQATVSFQSNLLEAAQPFIPSYKAKHPILPLLSARSEQQPLKRTRRQAISSNTPSKTNKMRRCESKTMERRNGDELLDLVHPLMDLVDMPMILPAFPQPDLDLLDHLHLSPPVIETSRDYQRDTQMSLHPLGEPKEPHQHHHHHHHGDPIHPAQSGGIAAHFNNIDDLLNDDPETTIVVKEVIVSPVEAHYGRAGKVGKVFCPPKADYKLRQHQTVQLKQNIFGQCHQKVNRILHPISVN